ncbi:glycosyltransferase [Oculatella sp. LEGE 06141]|uniref:glycosyltransferase family 2 protein n=1 Tax=Oculatella sp. LEGE 06141 TaxID=1828648 RepID=UPI00187F01AD|nr:glycosyltransferase [Oculatella sp. LEGE 06141]MBE9181330.1 glycosyltransferase [Oculatella sp. LEGE 06141]
MSNPCLSIIIPTYNRPHLVSRAVNSALEQTLEDVEVVVVDDASPEPVSLPDHPRLTVVRLPENKGTAAARNVGAHTARGRYITYLDDDDRLLPHMAEVSLTALAESTLPQPVAVLSGLEVVNQRGEVVQTRLPPTLPRGSHFFLEAIDVGQSFLSKQTLVVERELLLSIGGYDESFQSRVHTELFLRLNPVCSILGLPNVTYQLMVHEGPRISRNPALRQVSFHQLIRKHHAIFRAHPKAFADFVLKHALISYEMGQSQAAIANLLWAIRIHPRHVLGQASWNLRKSLQKRGWQMPSVPSSN